MLTTWFISGTCGFIMSHLARTILTQDPEAYVVGMDCRTYAADARNIEDLLSTNRFMDLTKDIRNKDFVLRAFDTYKPDYAVLGAAESMVDRSIVGPDVFMTTNVLGTFNQLEACRVHGVTKATFVSTDEVYSSRVTGHFTEQDPLKASSVYSASKASGDLLAGSYHTTYGVPVVRVRPTNNYGTHQHPEKLIPSFITRLARGERVPVYGNGLNVRTWLAVEDCCTGIIKATKEGIPGEAYNISSNVELNNLEVTRMILNAMSKPTNSIEYVTDRPGHDFRYAVDSSKLRSLGWVPGYDTPELFERKLQRVVEWYLKNRQG